MLLLGAMVAGIGASFARTMPVMAQSPKNFTGLLPLPQKPMRLTRRLERLLFDGNRIVIDRRWHVAFNQSNRDITVSGKQISAKVEAPANLDAFARIEESRRDDSMFPLTLSHKGVIMLGHQVDDDDAFGAAAREAERIIAASKQGPTTKNSVRRHLQQMQQASQSLLTTVPRDLFFPSDPPVHNIRHVTLPDGTIGEFELSYSAEPNKDSGWLDRAERKIITRLGESERYSSEVWSLVEM